jgi:hypothetical protein
LTPKRCHEVCFRMRINSGPLRSRLLSVGGFFQLNPTSLVQSCKKVSDTLGVENTDLVRTARAAESSARAAVKSVASAARAEARTETEAEILRLRKVLEEENAVSAARAEARTETEAEILRLRKEVQEEKAASAARVEARRETEAEILRLRKEVQQERSEMYRHMSNASTSRNWSTMVLWTPHTPNVVNNLQPSAQEQTLHMFTFAMRKRYEATACDKYKHEYEKMTFMRIGLLGQIGHFRDQAALLCQRAEEMISGPFDAVMFDSAAGKP